MHHKEKNRIGFIAAGLLLLFITIFFFSIRELKRVSYKPQKDITTAALAMRKILVVLLMAIILRKCRTLESGPSFFVVM